MATCPICGMSFKPCADRRRGEFNWRAVACSWECADQYLQNIRKSRMSKEEQNAQLGVTPEMRQEFLANNISE